MSDNENITQNLFGYRLIRDELIPDLLGNHTKDILYWAGKKLARNYACSNEGEMISFFERAEWGVLTIIKQKNDEIHFELSGNVIEERITHNDPVFTLEAGFIAEQIAMIKQYQTEAVYTRKKKNCVQIELKWDQKDPYSLPSRKASF
ncbi:YslB family protein [Jeotgalibacillus malaysiensis]|uniref:YslB family protein n=1 Tax=Jeotgalibacillus malaysiensis TaxID=1508404 RepID=UPI003850E32F